MPQKHHEGPFYWGKTAPFLSLGCSHHPGPRYVRAKPFLGGPGGGQGREAAKLVALPPRLCWSFKCFPYFLGLLDVITGPGTQTPGRRDKFLLVLDIPWGGPEKALT